MSDIFISYASEDKGRVQALARALERKGWSVWWDRRIPAGKSFDEVILEALKTARSVVVVWSKTSVKSTWVKNESRSGLRRNILFPVMLHNEVEIPIEFEHLQAAHLVDWRPGQDHAGFDQFLDDLAGLIGAPEKAGTQQPGPPVESPFPLEAREIPIIEPQAAQVDERRPRESAVSASSAQPLPYALIGGGLLAIVIAVSIYWLRVPEAPSPKIEPPSGQLPVQSSPTPSQTMTPPPITVPSRNPSSAVLPEKSVVAAEAKAVSPAELKPRLSADTAKKKSGKDGASTGAKPEETAETKLTKKPLDTPKTTARESDPSGPVRQLPEKQEQELLQVKQQLRKPDERSVPGLSSPLLQLAQPAQQQAMGHNVPSSHVQSTETFSPTITVEDGVPMVLVPAGEFMMGAGSVSSKYREDELPVHPVYLDGYYID